MKNLKINETPVRTSNNFGINNVSIDDIDFSKEFLEFENLLITGNIENFKISDSVSKKILTYGISKVAEKEVFEKANQELKIETTDSKNKILYIDCNFNEENICLIDNIEIIAKENTKSTIIITYTSNDFNKYYHNGIIRVKSEKNSNLQIVIINMLNIKSNNLISIENSIEDNAKLNYTIIDFGGKNSISNYYSNLLGDSSESNLNTIYLGKENQLFDINYIAELRGVKSKANIEVQGALTDNAKKNFKGTIDFKKGCKKAIGGENEFCMLLSKASKSKALPMLLCTEEDVEGNHSTASGKVDNKKLFYIMSRGISYKEAMKLIVKANFNSIIDTINDEELKTWILNVIDEKLN